MFNRRMQRFIHLIWLLLVLLVEAEAKKKRRSARSRRYGDNPIGLNTGLRTIGILALVVFIPAIAYFIYIVYKDPATPEVLTALWNEFKVKSVGYLGTRKTVKKDINEDVNDIGAMANKERDGNDTMRTNRVRRYAGVPSSATTKPDPPRSEVMERDLEDF